MRGFFFFFKLFSIFGDTCIFKQRLIISAVHVPYFLVFHMSHNLGKWGKYVAFLFASFNLNLRKISYSEHATGKKRKLDHRENNLRYGINSPKYASLPFQFQCIFLNFCRWLSVTWWRDIDDDESTAVNITAVCVADVVCWLLSF